MELEVFFLVLGWTKLIPNYIHISFGSSENRPTKLSKNTFNKWVKLHRLETAMHSTSSCTLYNVHALHIYLDAALPCLKRLLCVHCISGLIKVLELRNDFPSRARALWAEQGLCKQIWRAIESQREPDGARESRRASQSEPEILWANVAFYCTLDLRVVYKRDA